MTGYRPTCLVTLSIQCLCTILHQQIVQEAVAVPTDVAPPPPRLFSPPPACPSPAVPPHCPALSSGSRPETAHSHPPLWTRSKICKYVIRFHILKQNNIKWCAQSWRHTCMTTSKNCILWKNRYCSTNLTNFDVISCIFFTLSES